MPSSANIKYKDLALRASIILKPDRSALSQTELQVLYGASFVAQVAAWNAYVVGIVACFYQESADPQVGKYFAMHTLAESATKLRLDRFNTPNAENSRELIAVCTGYDPWPDWQWSAQGMNALAVRSRLNEILKVRHSLAHGFGMPGYSWNQTSAGNTRLTIETLTWMRRFLAHLVAVTDKGLGSHLTNVYGVVPKR